MPSHSDILFDFNNMMADEIGPSGIQRDEIDRLGSQLGPIHDGLTDLRRLGQLPFRDLPYHEEKTAEILKRVAEVRDRFDSLLLLGIGGSSLGAQFLTQALGGTGGMKLEVCNHLDAVAWQTLAERLDWERTLVLVVSKSGKTTETLAAFLFFEAVMLQTLGIESRKQILILTDPTEGPLHKIAKEGGIGIVDLPPTTGGRFSVLTASGLFPAACAGVDIQELLAGAIRMDERCSQKDPWFNPAMMGAALHHLLDTKRGRKVRVILPYGERLKGYAPWFAQLWGESLGKRKALSGKEVFAGTTPVVASGPQDQHSQLQLYLEGPPDKAVSFIASDKEPGQPLPRVGFAGIPEIALLQGRRPSEILEAERFAVESALTEAGCPNQTILLREVTPYAIGQLLYLAEVETVYAGELYNVNPFDQPAVERIKRYSKDFLEGRISHKKNRSYRI